MWSRPLVGFVTSIKIGAIAVTLSVASVGLYWGVIQSQGNFHAVKEGSVYRSAQLTEDELSTVARDHRIRSILNLRGAHPGQPWYDDEVTVSHKFGIAHYDYVLSARRLVTGARIIELLEIIRDAPKPLLIHCKAGADRTGLVSALYLFADERVSADQADRQLSMVYGHFPYLTSRTRAMDDSFWAFVGKVPITWENAR